MLSLCANSKKEFCQLQFASNLQHVCSRAADCSLPTSSSSSSVSMTQVRNLLLGRAHITRCKCCGHRKVKRGASSCEIVGEFERLCEQLAKPHGQRAMEKLCDPGEGALAFDCIRLDSAGMTAEVHWHPCAECPTPTQRLTMLADDMRESTCERCLLVLSFKAILLLLTFESCATAAQQSTPTKKAKSKLKSPQATTALRSSPSRTVSVQRSQPRSVVEFVLKQMPWRELLNRVKELKM